MLENNISEKLTKWRKEITQKQAKRDFLTSELAQEKAARERIKEKLLSRIAAQTIIQSAAELAQGMLEAQLSSVTSAALAAVFPEDPYEFLVNFSAKRGGTECEFFFKHGEDLLRLFTDDAGFGDIDVASNALRIAYLNAGGTRRVLIIDEPYKNLSKRYLAGAAEVLSELSHELDLQIIMITHIQEFADIADTVFNVTQDISGVSRVTRI